jgi:acetoin utilization deacetylase AcuC-like enzyme
LNLLKTIFSILGFAYMTNKLMSLADGKVVLVLEGGYELNILAECGKSCVEALLGRQVRFGFILR